MPAILVKPVVMSIYTVNGQRVPMPERMARATPDLKAALYGLRQDLEAAGGALFLSDLFRSYDMQYQAHLDFSSGKKSAYSPPPGGSMHEAGRAFDIELSRIKVSLPAFWEMARLRGVVPIIGAPDPGASEAWNFECRGSHQKVYDHYKAGRGSNFKSPAAAMAASAIVALGLRHDKFQGKGAAAAIQSALIRLGHDIGNIDGSIGPRTSEALKGLSLDGMAPNDQASALDALLMQQFPGEFFDRTADDINPFA